MRIFAMDSSLTVSVEDASFVFKPHSNPLQADPRWYLLLFNQRPDIWISFFCERKLVIVVDDNAAIQYLGSLPRSFRDRKRKLTGCKHESPLMNDLGGREQLIAQAVALREQFALQPNLKHQSERELTEYYQRRLNDSNA